MSPKYQFLGITGVFLLGLALGRYSLPSKVITETKTTEDKAIAENTQKDTQKHTKTVTTITKRPDGTEVTKIITKNDVYTEKHQDLQVHDQKTSDTRKEVDYDSRRLSLYAITEIGLFPARKPMFGAGFDYRFLGPFSSGLYGMQDGTMGITLGVSF